MSMTDDRAELLACAAELRKADMTRFPWLSFCHDIASRIEKVAAADAGVREVFPSVLASLAAAISLLERTPKAKNAAPSDKMFAQMLNDYKRSLRAGRDAYVSTPAQSPADTTEGERLHEKLDGNGRPRSNGGFCS